MLITCPECKNEVDKKALYCPNCEYLLSSDKWRGHYDEEKPPAIPKPPPMPKLMSCSECNNIVTNETMFCPHCDCMLSSDEWAIQSNYVEGYHSVTKTPVPKPKLMNCPDCDKEVSTRSKSCVHCGCPFEDEKNTYVGISHNYIKERFEQGKDTFQLHKRNIIAGITLATVVIIILFATGILGMSNTERIALRDIRTIQNGLLVPESIIVYEAFVIRNSSIADTVTLVHYGAQNRAGGITSDWVVVVNGRVRSHNSGNANERVDVAAARVEILYDRQPSPLGTGTIRVSEIDRDRLHRRLR